MLRLETVLIERHWRDVKLQMLAGSKVLGVDVTTDMVKPRLIVTVPDVDLSLEDYENLTRPVWRLVLVEPGGVVPDDARHVGWCLRFPVGDPVRVDVFVVDPPDAA